MTFFSIRDKIDHVLQSGFNIASDAEFFMNRDRRKLLAKNRSVKDRHEGEQCFILATGPSLNRITNNQRSAIARERTFAVNSFYKSEFANYVIPDYYVLVDNHYWGALSGEFGNIHAKFENDPPSFITDARARVFLPKDSSVYFLHAKNYPISNMRSDMTGNMSITMNVVGTAILSAIYMGFSTIYLMGVDHNLFVSLDNNHCYDDSLDVVDLPRFNLAFYLKDYHLTTEFHYLIAKTAEARGVKIFNLSEGSLLDAYPIRAVSTVL